MNKADDWGNTDEWELHRYNEHFMDITIKFGSAPPTTKQLLEFRKALPHLSQRPPSEVRALIDSDGLYYIKDIDVWDGREMVELLEQTSLEYAATGRTKATYVPMNKATSSPLVVEDHAEHERIVAEMKEAGVELAYIEVD